MTFTYSSKVKLEGQDGGGASIGAGVGVVGADGVGEGVDTQTGGARAGAGVCDRGGVGARIGARGVGGGCL